MQFFFISAVLLFFTVQVFTSSLSEKKIKNKVLSEEEKHNLEEFLNTESGMQMVAALEFLSKTLPKVEFKAQIRDAKKSNEEAIERHERIIAELEKEIKDCQ
jgi:uncharacterized protein (DUF2164 family)